MFTNTICKPEHLTWSNLSKIHKFNLTNKKIYYTWKMDGFSCYIKFIDNKMYIYIKDALTLNGQFVSKRDVPWIITNIKYPDIEINNIKLFDNNIILFGEAIYKNGRIKIFLFDINLNNKQFDYAQRHEILTKILSEVKKINELKFTIKDKRIITPRKYGCTISDMIVKDYSNNYQDVCVNHNLDECKFCKNSGQIDSSYYVNVQHNRRIILYNENSGSYWSSDGIIIYIGHKTYKIKYNNTYDLWLNAINWKLYSEDKIFIGYLINTNQFRQDNLYNLIEVQKIGNKFFKLRERKDKKQANTFDMISKIDNIHYKLVNKCNSRYFLNHTFKMKLSKNNLLTFEFRIFKEKLLNFLLLNDNKQNELNWLDIGCGIAHELNIFLILQNLRKYNNKLSKIYLMDNKINDDLYKRKIFIESNIEFLKKINIIKGNILSRKLYNSIKKNSLDIITCFLSVKDFNKTFFRNINRWLKPDGKICIIFYDSKLIPEEGLFSMEYNFGLKKLSEKYIQVYRNNNKKFTLEENLDYDYLKNIFEYNNFKIVSSFNVNESFDKNYEFIKMMKGIILKKNLIKESLLFNFFKNDFFKIKMSEFLNIEEYKKLNIIFSNIKWDLDEFDSKIKMRNDFFDLNRFIEYEKKKTDNNDDSEPEFDWSDSNNSDNDSSSGPEIYSDFDSNWT